MLVSKIATNVDVDILNLKILELIKLLKIDLVVVGQKSLWLMVSS